MVGESSSRTWSTIWLLLVAAGLNWATGRGPELPLNWAGRGPNSCACARLRETRAGRTTWTGVRITGSLILDSEN